jgi:hypothetical protein
MTDTKQSAIEAAAEAADKLVPEMVNDSDAVCRECRGRAGHWTGCPRQNDPWPSIQVHRKPTPAERAHQTILAYLSAIAEDEASVEAGAKALGPIWYIEELVFPADIIEVARNDLRNGARRLLSTLLERAKEQQT